MALLLVGLLPAQLPPEIELDRHMLRARQQLAAEQFGEAHRSLERVWALRAEHAIEIPEEFFFLRALVFLRVGLHDEAIEAVTEYLTLTGRDGERYTEALELLNRADEEKAAAEEEARRAREDAGRRAEAARLKAEEERRWAESVMAGVEFVRVPPGEFRMGSTSGAASDDERPVTQVRVSRGVHLGRYEVTQELWQAVMGTNPSKFSGCGRCPVENVSWEDVQDFIGRLNTRLGTSRYRLPTEAEWEYAARAGTSEDRYGNLRAIAWYWGNSRRGKSWGTHPVGLKAANAWGLHDMLGNVHEWVQDWYGRYPGGPVTDPTGLASGSYRVNRGGSWISDTKYCRASNRGIDSPGHRRGSLGFRLLKTE